MSIPRCRVMLGESESMSRLTLRDLMDELPDELYDFELDDSGPSPVDVSWLVAARPGELSLDDEYDAA